MQCCGFLSGLCQYVGNQVKVILEKSRDTVQTYRDGVRKAKTHLELSSGEGH